MTFSLSDYEPILNNWFETNLRYEGKGSAEFTSPVGSVVGSFAATFDEDGSTLVETIYDSISYDPDYEAGPLGFLTGAKPVREGNVVSWGVGGLENVCKQLSFSTAQGEFISTADVHLAGLSGTPDQRTRLRFYVPEARFETKNSAVPKYFVLPLFNFVGDMGYRLCGAHPLRIYSTPNVPADLPDEDKFIAALKAQEKNPVIGFTVEGQVWFIERLPDYDDRAAFLRSGGQRRITAVLVGEVGSHPVGTLTEFRSWLPTELISLLGFASGVEVGFSWVEIRDGNGGLIRRLHGHPWRPTFYEGDVLLKDFDVDFANRSGLGDILTRFLELPSDRRSSLEVAMNHARLGSLGSHLRLYDIVDHLCRGFECLCREYGLIEQKLLPMLSPSMQPKVKDVLADAGAKLRQLAKDARSAGSLDEARVLETIVSRTANAAQDEKKFGLAVVMMLQKFSLLDADIIDAHIAACPRSDRLRDWASVITNYRNATIHEGYLDFEKKHDASDVVRVSAHLKDAMVRVLLKAIGYTGTYEPVVARGFDPRSVDWVDASTDSSKFGFE